MDKKQRKILMAAALCERSLLENGYVWVGRLVEGGVTSFMLRNPRNGNRATIRVDNSQIEIRVNGVCVERSVFK